MNRMERRTMLNAGLGRLAKVVIAVVVALAAVGAQAADKPNIVVMMIDDIGCITSAPIIRVCSRQSTEPRQVG